MNLLSFWQINSVAAFLLGCVFAGILIPKIMLIAFRKKLFDEQDSRKIHHSSVPRLGGIAFAPVIFFCFAFLILMNLVYGDLELLREIKADVLPFAALTCSLILMYVIGIADDLIGVKYRAKFIFQVFCGIFFIISGVSIADLQGLFFMHELPTWLAYPFSVLLFVFIVNAINLIDGIDGLASGLSAVALTYYGGLFFFHKEYTYALLAFSTLGTVVPFFYYNVFGKAEKQQKIFMGDTGSLTIGTVLCFLCFKLSNICTADQSVACHSMTLSFSPLLVPCMDVVRVFFHRIKNGKSPFLPDQNHIHHKLLKLGMSQRTAMISILLASTLCIAFCNWLTTYINVTIVFIICIVVFTLLNCWLTKKIQQKKGETDKRNF